LIDDPLLGREVLGGYRLEKIVGWGAMGRVYRSLRVADSHPAAIKVIHPRLIEDGKLVRRFNREATIASRLDHPNIIRLIDQGTLSVSEIEELPALIMEYIDGPSLRSVLASLGHGLPIVRALNIGTQIARAVTHAHSQGIVHRDLKPANVMLLDGSNPADDRIKVLDFGIAKSTRDPGSHPTVKGTVLGSPHYISPEGALGEPATPSSDLYSLAAMLFECLSGHPPFDDPSPISVMLQHTSRPAPRLNEVMETEGIPPTVVELIAQNLAKDPAQRSASALELAEVLAVARALL
jgi:serine/threonine-protein kinase